MVKEFLKEQESLQTTLETSLANDFNYAPFSTTEILRRHQQLVSLWDWMSLLLCHGLTQTQVVSGVLFKTGESHVKLTPLQQERPIVSIEPWPFSSDRVELVCEGRHLLKTYAEEEEMREALRAAAPVSLLIGLVPGRSR
jgi:hypothetical protein